MFSHWPGWQCGHVGNVAALSFLSQATFNSTRMRSPQFWLHGNHGVLNTQTGRTRAMAFRLVGSGDAITLAIQSLVPGNCANGDINANKPANNWSRLCGQAFKAISDKNRQSRLRKHHRLTDGARRVSGTCERAITDPSPINCRIFVLYAERQPETRRRMYWRWRGAWVRYLANKTASSLAVVPVPYRRI